MLTGHGAADFREVLDFWFGPAGSPEFGNPREAWFRKSDEFDDAIRARFLDLHRRAADGQMQPWQAAPDSLLALILALDQFPRNLFRGSSRAFATDAQALAAAQMAVARGHDRALLPVQRWFIYLPFEHAEDLALQRRCLELFEGLRGDPDSASTIDYARRHYEIISRFGRFPHRNAVLGRISTPEEIEFLKQPGSGF
ncbi:MAG: DUF924 domain-containing protein [Betaproteobacteria bacterium]|nr:DUF924 domain-containing protein [Betaproteobacteria bacterium]